MDQKQRMGMDKGKQVLWPTPSRQSPPIFGKPENEVRIHFQTSGKNLFLDDKGGAGKIVKNNWFNRQPLL